MGRIRKVLALFILLSLFVSSFSYADSILAIPKWNRFILETGEFACYDFNGAKELKLFEAKCREINNIKLLLENENLTLRELNTNLGNEFVLLLEDRSHLKKINVNLTKENQNLLNQNQTLRARDIFGDALPWYITGSVIFIGIGFGLAIWATS